MNPKILEADDREAVGFEWAKLGKVKPGQLGVRFAFGAVVAVIAAIAGMLGGPVFGGLFLAFPAILPASLTLIEEKEGLTKAWADASGGALGSVGMAAFAFSAMLLLHRNPIAALLIALLAWLAISAGLYFMFRLSGVFLRWDRLMR